MATLEQRLFHLFGRDDIEAARSATDVRVTCPRVGTVNGTVGTLPRGDAGGGPHTVSLELSACRRGGMTLEARCSSPHGRAGRPCPALVAVLLEVDRRGLLAGVHENTPITLEIVPEEGGPEGSAGTEPVQERSDDPDADGEGAASWPAPGGSAAGGVDVAVRRAPSTRQPAWATDLEERRRLVEPAVRTRAVSLTESRRHGGALVFLLDLGASAE